MCEVISSTVFVCFSSVPLFIFIFLFSIIHFLSYVFRFYVLFVVIDGVYVRGLGFCRFKIGFSMKIAGYCVGTTVIVLLCFVVGVIGDILVHAVPSCWREMFPLLNVGFSVLCWLYCGGVNVGIGG